MNQLRVTDSNAGGHSDGAFLGMSGDSAWWFMGALIFGILTTLLLAGVMGMEVMPALMVASIPMLVSVVLIFTLVNGKPRRYPLDFFESLLIRVGMMPHRCAPAASGARSTHPLLALSGDEGEVPVVRGTVTHRWEGVAAASRPHIGEAENATSRAAVSDLREVTVVRPRGSRAGGSAAELAAALAAVESAEASVELEMPQFEGEIESLVQSAIEENFAAHLGDGGHRGEGQF